MIVQKLDLATIAIIDKVKPSTIDLHDSEVSEFVKQVPYYIREINYMGNNPDVMDLLYAQYVLLGSTMLDADTGIVSFVRPKYSIDLDITTKCNLACPNCNKLSNFKSTWKTVDIPYVKNFIQQNEHRGEELLVKILGGEPTLHKDIQEIIALLVEAKFKVIMLTNGIKEFTPCLPIGIENSSKEKGTLPDFHTTMVAPKDLECFAGVDYSVGCTNASLCGYGNKDGKYYPCPTGGYINEHISAEYGIPDFGRASLERAEMNRPEAFKTLCQYCGLFKKLGYHNVDKKQFSRTTEQEFSKSWEFFRLKHVKGASEHDAQLKEDLADYAAEVMNGIKG